MFSFFYFCDVLLLVTRVENERQTIEELRTNVGLLEHEKREKAMDRMRYEKEIEQLEENWKKESNELLMMISRLQDDNRKLSSSLKEREEQNISKSMLHPRLCAALADSHSPLEIRFENLQTEKKKLNP